MSYQVLARKWRPKRFSEVIGQDHITRTLKNSVKTGKIAHAYLLTGTRGVGKTTIARIFAKAIRCLDRQEEMEPCLKCSACLEVDKAQSIDYIEIDGASNNSVEDVRDLIENVQYLPTSGKYKVYVVDEVHMLTVNAFNALLKTLEEPPEHVVFIFATTDPQKLLGTVLSRCQRLDFKNVPIQIIKNHLLNITKKEAVDLESEKIVELIAKYARGSVRDSLSILDQVISLTLGNKITEKEMNAALGLVSNESLNKIVTNILSKNKEYVGRAFSEALEQNVDLKVISQQILEEFYNLVNSIDNQGNIVSSDYSEEDLSRVSLVEVVWLYESLVKDFEWALKSMQPEQSLGFVLAKTTLRDQILGNSNAPIIVKKKSSVDVEPIEENSSSAPAAIEEVSEETLEKVAEAQTEEPAMEEPVNEGPTFSGPKSWDGFLKYLGEENRALSLNIERGNIISPETFGAGGNRVEIAFEQGSKIFLDVLQEGDNRIKLIELLKNYLELDQVHLEFRVLTEADSEQSNFKSAVQIEEDRIAQEIEQKRQDILNNKFVKDAEKIFNAKVDKIVLSEEG